MWQKESYKPVAVAVRIRSTPYVVTCNIFVLYCSWQTQTPLGELTAHPQTTLAVMDLRGPTSLANLCLLLTHVALWQRVRSVITSTRYINVLTD